MSDFTLHRIGQVMAPEPGNPHEVEGVLNPGAVRGRDGQLYLFPRLVAKGNYSRIGVARVLFDANGDPCGVERLGIALEPQADYELRPDGGGCEDARVTYFEPLGHYVMSYVAFSPRGPRVALAISKDLLHWERLGLATFQPYGAISFDGIDDKDGCVFPMAVPDPGGRPALAILHRPLFPGTRPEEKALAPATDSTDLDRESIWISYRDVVISRREPYRLCKFTSHHRLAAPAAPWEQLKIGGGTPPILTRHGWLIVYHGVCQLAATPDRDHPLCYSAGVMVLAKDRPREIRYRSAESVLTPQSAGERVGTVDNVVFPTGVDRRDDLGTPDRIDVYYGMADSRIGVASLTVPASLP